MGWASTVPAAIDGLVQAFTASPDLEDVLVMDGPAIASQAALRVLSVGYTAVPGETAVEAQSAPDGLAGNPNVEQYLVRCTAAVIGGATDVKAVRDAAYGIMSAAGAAIVRDQRLGGAVTRASMGSHQLMQEQTDRGAQCLLVFEVDVDAFTRR
jgi:hypothetical protein